MAAPIIDVLDSGAVCLGDNVVCDGFAEGYSFRVQTHIHEDHMGDFDRSKGLQDLLMSAGTYALLVAERNADLEYRDNLIRIPHDKVHTLNDGSKLSMLPSNHMLGACQVALELPDGRRIGYSGDFGWPIDKVIEVDELVVDSTYGAPDSKRGYTQDEAEDCLLGIVSKRLRYGSVHIKAHRGTIERVLQVLGGQVKVPILASERLIREVDVYQQHGLAGGGLEALDSESSRSATERGAYVRLYSKGDGFGNDPVDGTSITCSAYMMANADHPLLTHSDRSYSVALSNHADFDETLEYVKATRAKRIVTDNTQTHGVDLAIAINSILQDVQAEPSTNRPAPRWS